MAAQHPTITLSVLVFERRVVRHGLVMMSIIPCFLLDFLIPSYTRKATHNYIVVTQCPYPSPLFILLRMNSIQQQQLSPNLPRPRRSSSPDGHRTGMFFSETVVFDAAVAVRGLNSQWNQSSRVRLTSDSILIDFLPFVPLTALKKLKLDFNKTKKHVAIKAVTEETTTLLRANQDIAAQLWGNLIWTKLAILNSFCNPEEHFKGRVEGCILKKGEILGTWEERWVSISTAQGLQSGKGPKGHKSLAIKGVKQLWTRFELVKGKGFLILKLWFGLVKQEFAVPTEQAVLWAQAFYSLLGK